MTSSRACHLVVALALVVLGLDLHAQDVGLLVGHAVEGLGLAVGVVLGDFDLEDVVVEPVGHGLDVGGHGLDLVLRAAVPCDGAPVVGSAFAAGELDIAAAHGAVAAGVLLGGLLEHLDLGAGGSGGDGAGLAGEPEAHDDDVGLDIPGFGQVVDVGGRLGERRVGGGGQSGGHAHAGCGGALYKRTTASGHACILPLKRRWRAVWHRGRRCPPWTSSILGGGVHKASSKEGTLAFMGFYQGK